MSCILQTTLDIPVNTSETPLSYNVKYKKKNFLAHQYQV